MLQAVFERFNQEARQLVVHTQAIARELRHPYIGTEHLLLACFASPEIAAGKALAALGLTAEDVRERVLAIVGIGEGDPTDGQIPFTPRAKKALELALREALSLGHNEIESPHVLLGLVRQQDGVAMQVLAAAGISGEQVRETVIAMLPGTEASRGERQAQVARARQARAFATTSIAEDVTFSFTAVPDVSLREALRAAALRALTDGRQEFSVADLRAVLGDEPPPA